MEEKWNQAHENQTSTREERAKRLGLQRHGCQPPMRALIRADNGRTSSRGIGQFPLRIGSFSFTGVTQIVAKYLPPPDSQGLAIIRATIGGVARQLRKVGMWIEWR
jgi:hypothetical protein